MSDFDSDRFIIEVEQRPAIWDPRCNEYSNKLAKGRAWDELCYIFVSGFSEMDSLMKNKSAMNLQRKWKSFRDCFRRELLKLKTAKCGSAADCRRKEYIYYKQLSFLLPICESRPHQEEEASEGPVEEGTLVSQDFETPPRCSLPKRKRKSSTPEEQLLLQVLAKNIERKSAEVEDPDRHFLLSLLPHFKSIPESAKLQVQGEFINILQKYKQQPPLGSQQFPSSTPNFFHNSSQVSITPPCTSQAPQSFTWQHNVGPSSLKPHHTKIQHYYSDSVAPKQVPAVEPDCASPESGSASQLSDNSSISSD